MNWANTTAKIGADAEGCMYVHFTDDNGAHAYLTVEGVCHVLVKPAAGPNTYADAVTPYEAFYALTGHKVEDALDINDMLEAHLHRAQRQSKREG